MSARRTRRSAICSTPTPPPHHRRVGQEDQALSHLQGRPHACQLRLLRLCVHSLDVGIGSQVQLVWLVKQKVQLQVRAEVGGGRQTAGVWVQYCRGEGRWGGGWWGGGG